MSRKPKPRQSAWRPKLQGDLLSALVDCDDEAHTPTTLDQLGRALDLEETWQRSFSRWSLCRTIDEVTQALRSWGVDLSGGRP
jgi:hypothetical protein